MYERTKAIINVGEAALYLHTECNFVSPAAHGLEQDATQHSQLLKEH